MIKDLHQQTYNVVGHCIYCGATQNLENEHIVPYALSGTAVLPRSTCRVCAKITGQFEQIVLRGPMWGVRVLRELKSRTKHVDAPKAFPLLVFKDGKEEKIMLPVKEYPIMLHFPEFSLPSYLTQDNSQRGIKLTGVVTILFGPSPEEVAKKIGVTRISITNEYNPIAFARTIAKIGYSYAVAEGLRGRIDGEPPLLPALLGKSDDIGRWVGTLPKPLESHPGLLHRIAVHEDHDKGILISEVQLFAYSQTPSYVVILGQLKRSSDY